MSKASGGVTYKDVNSDWKLIGLFHFKPQFTTVFNSYHCLDHSEGIFIVPLQELVFLSTFQLPWPMAEVLASTDFSSIFL
jgi:hypothetical protein